MGRKKIQHQKHKKAPPKPKPNKNDEPGDNDGGFITIRNFRIPNKIINEIVKKSEEINAEALRNSILDGVVPPNVPITKNKEFMKSLDAYADKASQEIIDLSVSKVPAGSSSTDVFIEEITEDLPTTSANLPSTSEEVPTTSEPPSPPPEDEPTTSEPQPTTSEQPSTIFDPPNEPTISDSASITVQLPVTTETNTFTIPPPIPDTPPPATPPPAPTPPPRSNTIQISLENNRTAEAEIQIIRPEDITRLIQMEKEVIIVQPQAIVKPPVGPAPNVITNKSYKKRVFGHNLVYPQGTDSPYVPFPSQQFAESTDSIINKAYKELPEIELDPIFMHKPIEIATEILNNNLKCVWQFTLELHFGQTQMMRTQQYAFTGPNTYDKFKKWFRKKYAEGTNFQMFYMNFQGEYMEVYNNHTLKQMLITHGAFPRGWQCGYDQGVAKVFCIPTCGHSENLIDLYMKDSVMGIESCHIGDNSPTFYKYLPQQLAPNYVHKTIYDELIRYTDADRAHPYNNYKDIIPLINFVQRPLTVDELFEEPRSHVLSISELKSLLEYRFENPYSDLNEEKSAQHESNLIMERLRKSKHQTRSGIDYAEDEMKECMGRLKTEFAFKKREETERKRQDAKRNQMLLQQRARELEEQVEAEKLEQQNQLQRVPPAHQHRGCCESAFRECTVTSKLNPAHRVEAPKMLGGGFREVTVHRLLGEPVGFTAQEIMDEARGFVNQIQGDSCQNPEELEFGEEVDEETKKEAFEVIKIMKQMEARQEEEQKKVAAAAEAVKKQIEEHRAAEEALKKAEIEKTSEKAASDKSEVPKEEAKVSGVDKAEIGEPGAQKNVAQESETADSEARQVATQKTEAKNSVAKKDVSRGTEVRIDVDQESEASKSEMSDSPTENQEGITDVPKNEVQEPESTKSETLVSDASEDVAQKSEASEDKKPISRDTEVSNNEAPETEAPKPDNPEPLFPKDTAEQPETEPPAKEKTTDQNAETQETSSGKPENQNSENLDFQFPKDVAQKPDTTEAEKTVNQDAKPKEVVSQEPENQESEDSNSENLESPGKVSRERASEESNSSEGYMSPPYESADDDQESDVSTSDSVDTVVRAPVKGTSKSDEAPPPETAPEAAGEAATDSATTDIAPDQKSTQKGPPNNGTPKEEPSTPTPESALDSFQESATAVIQESIKEVEEFLEEHLPEKKDVIIPDPIELVRKLVESAIAPPPFRAVQQNYQPPARTSYQPPPPPASAPPAPPAAPAQPTYAYHPEEDRLPHFPEEPLLNTPTEEMLKRISSLLGDEQAETLPEKLKLLKKNTLKRPSLEDVNGPEKPLDESLQMVEAPCLEQRKSIDGNKEKSD